jgi:hypothetical protein
MKSIYVLVVLCFLLILIPPPVNGVVQQSWYKSFGAGSCVTAVDTNDDGTVVFAGLGNGSIIAYTVTTNTTDGTQNASVFWSYSTNTSSTKRSIKKLVSDSSGDVVWISEANETGFISSSGAVGTKVNGTNRNMTDVGIMATGNKFAVSELTPPRITVYEQTGNTIYVSLNRFNNSNWTKIGYDPLNNWIVAANQSDTHLYLFNITGSAGWYGWDQFNPTHSSTRNASQLFLDSFPYRQNFSAESSAAVRGVTFNYSTGNTSASNLVVKINNTWYEYNRAITGHSFYWTLPGTLEQNQNTILNFSIVNGSTYYVVFKAGYQNYTFYYGNITYNNSIFTSGNMRNNGTAFCQTFTSSTTWTPYRCVTRVDYVVVAGGGGPGYYTGGGGGAGGMLNGTNYSVAYASYTITVGTGGAVGPASVWATGYNGLNSSFGNVTNNFTTVGGGAGGGAAVSGVAGGSGGGGGYSGNGGAGVSGQGYSGGSGSHPVYEEDPSYAGGGGGAGSAGGTISAGAGRQSSITGVLVWYANGSVGAGSGACAGAPTSYGGGGCCVGAGGYAGNAGVVILKYFIDNIPVFDTPPTASYIYTQQARDTNYVMNLVTTRDFPNPIVAISVPSTGTLASIGTAQTPLLIGTFYQQYVTSTDLGVYICATSGGVPALYPGVPYDIKTSNSGTASIEGRGNYWDIYDSSAVVKAQSLTGNNIRSVDSAMSSGLLAAAGGDEGKLFVLSHVDSVNWYSLYTGSANAPINAVATSWNGECVVVGRNDGNFEYYNTNVTITPTPTPSYVDVQVRVYKDGSAYTSQPVTIYSSTVTPYVWTPIGTSYTDGTGTFTYTTLTGTYYRFVVNNVVGTTSGEGEVIWQSNAASTLAQIFITSASTPYEWNAYYQTSSNNVTVVYSDHITPTSVIVTIKDLKTNLDVLTRVYYSTPNFILEYHDESGTGSYQVSVIITRMGTSIRDQRIVTSPNTYGTILPNDQYITWAISTFVLMLIAGMFSYSNSKRGALAVVVIAVLMMWFKLLPFGMMTVAMLAAIFAVMSLFASRVQ